jgi:similar to stage IV sporulation protein
MKKMNKLTQYKRGTITLEVNSLSLERFINLLWKNGIIVKNVVKKDICTMIMDIELKDYFIVKNLAKRTGTKINILNRRGISFLRIKYKHRKAFLIGVFIFVCIIYYLGTFIWNIDIETENNISPYEIRQQLNGYGVIPGVNKKDIDVFGMEDKLMDDNDEIVWVRARVEGTRLKIKIAERQAPPNLIEDDTPCDLVATKDGVIVRVYTKAGTAVVSEGDVVKKGDIVVKGEQGNEENIYLVHSEGDVIARTFYEKKKTVKLIKNTRKRTGNITEKIYFEIMGKKVFLKNGLNKFENYDKIIDSKSFIKRETYYEVIEEEIPIKDIDKTIEDTLGELYSEIVVNFDKSVKIVDEIKDIDKSDDNFSVRLLIVAEENIAKPQKIKIIEIEDKDKSEQ